MTIEEKKLLKELLTKSTNLSEKETHSEEINDEVLVDEINQGIELLTYATEALRKKGVPGFLKKWLKRLWYHIKKAIANFIREIACEIDPDC